MSEEPQAVWAVPQEQLPPYYISIKELSQERSRYQFPAFQRDKVWRIRIKQMLINAILSGKNIPPLAGWQEVNDNGQSIWMIIDGRQRIDAILSFLDGEYKTWSLEQKRAVLPEPTPPIEEKKFFEQLPPRAKNILLDYRIQINKEQRISDKLIRERFLEINLSSVSLNAAERLRVYASKAKEAAERIAEHPFHEDFFDGDSKRAIFFQDSLLLLAMELTEGGMLSLQSSGFIRDLAAGKYDKSIEEHIIQSILDRLDIVSHIYAGTHFTERGVIIPMYQSVIFLEEAGYIIQQADKGKLTTWISGLLAESRRAIGMPSYRRPVSRLQNKQEQQMFWEKHRRTVMALLGINEEATAAAARG